ncbi:MAG TPA: cytochrome c biogenesis protein CcsA [Terriglobales bacterium]|nr:cytochrome c biogenesis protein CcsA [Terriglobales bacterium]
MKRAVFTMSAVAVALLLSYGLREALQVAPTEATMGNIQRIFYYHVPSYATAFTMFAVNLLASVFYLVRRNTPSAAAADAAAVSAAELGVIFCSVGLLTGMLWAKPVWGIWWTWDARLTSTFVLWLIYVSYLMLRRLSMPGQAPTLAAVLAIFGFVDVPIVYMSIRWWRTQHPQPVIFGEQGQSGLDPAMVPALLINLAAFLCYGGLVFWVRYKLERARQELHEAQALQSIRLARAEAR